VDCFGAFCLFFACLGEEDELGMFEN
jgi:hypothetical protein